MHTFTITRGYDVSPAALFDALAAGALFLGCGAIGAPMAIDAREGGAFTVRFDRHAIDAAMPAGPGIPAGSDGTGSRDVTGVFTRVVAYTMIEFTWLEGTTVTLTITPDGAASRLTLTHDGIATGELAATFDAGWRAGLDGLVVPALDHDHLVGTDTERGILESYLDFHRGVIVRKVRDVSETDARRRFVASLTTLIGLVKHMTGVERNWFHHFLARRSREEVGPNNRGSDESWVVGEDETVASVIAEYEAVCAESRRIAAGLDMDDHVPHPRLGRLSVRMVLIHMVEETARHAGHADILRELTDGVTGVDPQ